MSHQRALKALRQVAYPPAQASESWYASAEEGVEWLKSNAGGDYVVLRASLGCVFVNAVLAPTDALTPPDAKALIGADLRSDRTWIIQHEWGGDGRRIYLDGPIRGPGLSSLSQGEALVFRRSFSGYAQHRTTTEINQRLVHALDLFFLPERSAWCRLDERGDLEDVVIIVDQDEEEDRPFESIVLIKAEPLAEYMAVSRQALFFKFDFTRLDQANFTHWGEGLPKRHDAPDLFYHLKTGPGRASYANGGMVVRTGLTVEEMVRRAEAKANPATRRYEIFKIEDRKNKVLAEVSCDPDSLSNYFTQSDKPWEISPAYFRPEVLARFKADPEKYELTERTIGCRNAWYLKTYDINEAGQVHTYIGYLANLPYEEQQYWKLYNEWPKAGLSKRAVENDLLGQVASDHDPLAAIKQRVAALDRQRPAWWKPRGPELAERVLPPATTAAKEWADEILALDQLIVEGFIKTPLVATATKLGVTIDVTWASLRVIEAILEGQGRPSDEAKAIVAPLRRLHHLRSKVKGHASNEGKALERQALTAHGTFRAHFLALCGEIDVAFSGVVAALETAA